MTTNHRIALAHDFVEQTGTNIFLTGRAGTGKTTFLHSLRERCPKRMVVVAPTGVAAINAGGVTMHSFFQLNFGVFVPNTTHIIAGGHREIRKFNKTKIAILRSMELLVIDEISMVRADMLDAVDEVLRRYRDRTKPFGGVQLLMIGDLQQLAPVVKDADWEILRDHYRSPFFFDSHALKQTQYTSIELTHIYRQSDNEFIELLARVRDNSADSLVLEKLNKRYIPGFNPSPEQGYITLTSHNNVAREINDSKLFELPSKEYTFTAKIEGEFPEQLYPVDENLKLKCGAQVMFAKNDPSPMKLFVNGTIGTITALDSEHIEVAVVGMPEPILVELGQWENSRYTIDNQTKEITETVDGVYTQYPLKTAWAITIHKSQGLTFERAVIDAADSFSHGQVYVALSRCKSLEGMVLRAPLERRSIINDTTVRDFNEAVEQNQPSQADLALQKQSYYKQLLQEMFDFTTIELQLKFMKRYTGENLSNIYPRLIEKWTSASDQFSTEITTVSRRFCTQIERLMSPEYATDSHLSERAIKGAEYFATKCTEILLPLIAANKVEVDNKETRKVLKNALEQVSQAVEIKMATLHACATGGFTVKSYMEAKAKKIVEIADAPKAKVMAAVEKSTKREKIETSQGDIENPELFRLLKSWRTDKTKELNVPAFMIMHQKTLISIANTMPANKRELESVKGIGKKFIDKYGAEIIALLDDFRHGRIGEQSPDSPSDYDPQDDVYI